jgi:hypothetical protein
LRNNWFLFVFPHKNSQTFPLGGIPLTILPSKKQKTQKTRIGNSIFKISEFGFNPGRILLSIYPRGGNFMEDSLFPFLPLSKGRPQKIFKK